MITTAQNTKANRLLMRVLTWREDHISERTFLLILAFVVGVLSGFAALLLKFLISIIASTLSEHINITGANYL
ncbi:MAG: chloride channel protein, partial [Candidatus Limisoma sp.]